MNRSPVVSNATTADMQVLETTLGTATADIAETGIGAPAIVCIGRVGADAAMS
jgi:uroporphyrin-III C-methyltransferase